ncbi:MAG: hypothetical protein FIB01_09855 [Gemmatimonadetes bacterium]|nr:hypothetical protein [Gemmatimonadota bacterium]
MANVWLLAHPYGYPSVLSSYAFSDNVMGPPSDAAGNTSAVSCAARMESATSGQWVCEHRDPAIRNMVRFRKVVAGTEVTNWWSNGNNAIAFSRGSKGFVAISREATAVAAQVATALAPGTYCDRLTGGKGSETGSCIGKSIVVGAGGIVEVNLAPNTAIAIDVETLVPPR